MQWWWRTPNRTDELGQLFWFDDDGRPEAAAVLVDFTGGGSAVYREITFCPFLMPDARPDQVAFVVERGLAHAAEHGFTSVELEVDRADGVMQRVLAEHGFSIKEEGVLVECWMDADARSDVSQAPDGYRLVSRSQTSDRPHHMSDRNGEAIEERLLQTSLYDPDLDLVILDDNDHSAAYGLFWYDPVTSTGVVEPMRTNDEHQRKGLARHLLTTGVDLLAKRGADRISIGYEPDNPASGHLYRSVGFEPVTETDLFASTPGE